VGHRALLLSRETSLVAPVLLGLLLSGYSAVSSTNFGGYDEWLIRSLGDRMVLSVPYANRPLNFLWTLPGGLLSPKGFTGYYVVHGLYLWLAGVLVFIALRRLWPEVPYFALLGAAFVVTWAPSDRTRLSTVQLTLCSGFTMSMLLAVVLLLEARWRGSRPLLMAAGATAWVTVRGYEATLPLLLVAPLLAFCVPAAARGWPRVWWLAWAAPVALATAQVLAPALVAGDATRYQLEDAGLDAQPAAVLSRLVHQYAWHLLPLVTSNPSELRHGRVALAAAFLVGGCALIQAFARESAAGDARPRRALLTIAGGLVAAGLGYGPYVLSRIGGSTDRTEFISGPGIAAALAAAAVLAARPVPPPRRWLVTAALGAWVVAVGTGRTLAMQHYWDRHSAFPQQAATLRDLEGVAPDLRPGTLVVLVDHCRDWPAVFSFRHAVEWTYGRRATGFLWRRGLLGQLLYPTAFGMEGVRTVPWESIQDAWDDRPTLHRYDEIVAVRRQGDCTLRLARQWPPELPPLPPGARYAPMERILGRTFR
jgi:hypothetical protein